MSVFRAVARVRSPDGREWELYAYKLELPRKGAAGGGVRKRLRRWAAVPVAAARSLGSSEWTVEAITFMPQRQSYVWRTTREYRGQVLAQVEGNLARGHVPQQLRNATYVGWRRSAR